MTRRIPKVTSLGDLRQRAATDPRYERLAIVAANNLGGAAKNRDAAMRWLATNANETDERGVVAEVNFCRDFIDAVEAQSRERKSQITRAATRRKAKS